MIDYEFTADCVTSEADDLYPMIENAIDITYRTFFKHVDHKEVNLIFPQYDTDSRNGLTLKNDWHVSYHRSSFKGMKCYYMVHSAIEFIFTKR